MNLKKLATSFSRGLNQAASHTLNDGECQESENFVFKDRSATVRKGFQVHAQVTSGPIIALEKFYQSDGDAFFTAVGAGQLHYSVTSGVFTSLSSNPISGSVSKAVYDGAMYFTDFSTPVQFFNGNLIGVAGLSSPVFKKQLDDCEDASRWVAQDINGGVTADNNYMHRDKGSRAITVFASNPATAHVSQYGGINNTIDYNIAANIIDPVSNGGQNGTPNMSRKSIIMDTSGDINVAYTNNSSLYIARSANKGSSWSNTLVHSSARHEGADLHMHTSGGVQIVMKGIGDVITANLWSINSGLILSTSSLFPTTATEWATAVNKSGDISIVYARTITGIQRQLTYRKHFISSGTWTDASTIGIYSDSGMDIAIDRSGVERITWANTSNLGAASGIVRAIHYLNSISGIYCITSADSRVNFGPTRISVDASSNAHIFYNSSGSLYNIKHSIFFNGSGIHSQQYDIGSEGKALFSNGGGGAPCIDSSSQMVNFIWAGYSTDSPSIPTLRVNSYISGVWSVPSNYNKHPLDHSKFAFSVIDELNHFTTTYPSRMSVGWNVLWWGSGNTLNYKHSSDARYFNTATPSPAFNLTVFASDVTSHSGYDCIQLYTVPNRRESISSFLLKFVDAAGYQAIANITSTSAWASCSNHEWGMTVTYPKANMSSTNAAFNWAACDMQVVLTPVSGQGLAKVAVDNVRLLNSPPIINNSVTTSARVNLLFWGSSAVAKKKKVNLDDSEITPVLDENGNLVYPTNSISWGRRKTKEIDVIEFDAMQLEGLKQITDPLPNGTYYYKTTFVKESPSGFEIESNPSFQSSGFIVSSNTSSWTYLNLIAIPVAPDNLGAIARRIYRRKSDEKEMRFVYTIHDNIETTFNDTVPATTLGWALQEDHNPPPAAKLIFRGSDQRMYYFNISDQGENYPSRVRVSKPYEPYYVPYSNTVDISPDDGTEGTGMFEFQGIVHLLKERATWSLEQGPVCKNPSIGCVAPDSIATGRNEVFWLSDQGPIMYNGRFYNISHSRDTSSLYRIQTILDRLPKDYLKNAKGVYYDGYYLLAVTDSGSTVNNLVICYDVDNDVWTTFSDINVTAWAVWNGYKDGYRLFFGNTSGQICEMFQGDYDVSSPIRYKIRSKEFGIPTPEAFYRKGYLFTENLDNTVKTITGQPYYDFTQTSSHAESIELSGTFNTTKFTFPDNDSASFFSFGASGSGRIKINIAEIYRKDENIR